MYTNAGADVLELFRLLLLIARNWLINIIKLLDHNLVVKDRGVRREGERKGKE